MGDVSSGSGRAWTVACTVTVADWTAAAEGVLAGWTGMATEDWTKGGVCTGETGVWTRGGDREDRGLQSVSKPCTARRGTSSGMSVAVVGGQETGMGARGVVFLGGRHSICQDAVGLWEGGTNAMEEGWVGMNDCGTRLKADSQIERQK